MHVSATSLVDAWERGLGRKDAERPLEILAAATGADRTEVGRWPLGARDDALLSLRESAFGSDASAVASCSACGEQLEVDFRLDDVRAPAATARDETDRLDDGSYSIEFRLPTGDDVVAAAGAPDVDTARLVLLERCVVSCRGRDGAEVAAGSLPPGVVVALSEAVAAADPQADVRIDMTCPACAHRWQETFDIGEFLWTELSAWAQRTLRDVAELARAYGWTEREVLSLSPLRRRMYLAMAVP